MDGLTQILSTIGMGGSTAAAPAWQKILLGGMFGAGELGNLLQEKKLMDLQNQQAAYTKYVTNLVQNPAQISKMATSEAAPLSQALQQTVMNAVQGDMAARGLSQAPGIFGATESQALAPYVQQNYNTALQAVLSQLGIPISSMSSQQGSFQKPQDLSALLKQFLNSFGTKGTVPTQSPQGGGLTPPTIDPIFGDANASFDPGLVPSFAGGGS